MESMQFDKENKNSKWYDVIVLEMNSMQEYKVFKKCDKAILLKIPVLCSSRSPALRGSSTLLASPVIFS